MKIPRRLLPSVSLLLAFEAVARTSSVTVAAGELDLTQSAVSRQIKALEEQLGIELFIRERQTLRLTLAGWSYAREIRDVLQRMSTASINIKANPSGGTLNLAVLPTFATRWLIERLPAFFAANPEVKLNIITRMTQLDFHQENVDAAVHFGLAEWPGAEFSAIRTEEILPVCAPELLRNIDCSKPEDIKGHPLLILASRIDGWERWLEANGAPATGVHGMMFDQFELIIRAAVAGLGVALLPTFLIENELKNGDLVPVIDLPHVSEEQYYLTWPSERANYLPLMIFKDWLLAQTAQYRIQA